MAETKSQSTIKSDIMLEGMAEDSRPFSDTEGKPLEIFFDDIYNIFKNAASKSDKAAEYYYNIAGNPVNLSFAGSALIPFITPALQHLKAGPSCGFTICLFDSVSTKANIPPPPWTKDNYTMRGDIRGCKNKNIYVSFSTGSGVLSIFNTRSKMAIYWTYDASRLHPCERASPLLTIFNWWLGRQNYQAIHGAVVGNSRGAVLLVGKGGSGKSTTALACLEAGLLYLGDDYVLLGTGGDCLFAYTLYNSAKYSIKDITYFPTLLSLSSEGKHQDRDKNLVFLHPHYRSSLVSSLPLRAIALCSIGNSQRTSIEKTAQSAIFYASIPNTISQLAGTGPEVFKILGGFIKRLPAYNLELGSDIAEIPRIIRKLLSDI